MAHRKKPKIFVRKLTRTGKYTYYVVVPKEMVQKLHWRERQKLTVRDFRRGILIKDWKK